MSTVLWCRWLPNFEGNASSRLCRSEGFLTTDTAEYVISFWGAGGGPSSWKNSHNLVSLRQSRWASSCLRISYLTVRQLTCSLRLRRQRRYRVTIVTWSWCRHAFKCSALTETLFNSSPPFSRMQPEILVHRRCCLSTKTQQASWRYSQNDHINKPDSNLPVNGEYPSESVED